MSNKNDQPPKMILDRNTMLGRVGRRVAWRCECGAVTFAAKDGDSYIIGGHLKPGTVQACPIRRSKQEEK